MLSQGWKTDIELINESYYQHIVEEGLTDYIKGFTRKIFKRGKDKSEGFDDVLIDQLEDHIKKLTDRLKAEGPDAIKKFLDIMKNESDIEFKGVVESNSRKILKSLRYGVDVAADGIANFIYNFIEDAQGGFVYTSRDWKKTPFKSSFNITGEDAESVDRNSPRNILNEIENVVKSANLNKSFGFNSNATNMVADKLAELSDKLRSSAGSRRTRD